MVFHKHTGKQFPKSGFLRGLDESGHRYTSDAVPAGRSSHIERDLRNSGVTLPWPVRKCSAKSNDLAIALDYNDRMSAVEPGAYVFRRAQSCFKRGDPVGDAFV